MLTYTVECGALTQVPCYETHKRGKNWCAKIWRDPKSPGGLGREFWEHAKGDFFYILPSNLPVGTPLEFGADYYSGGGNPSRKRRWFVVVGVTETELRLEEYQTAAEAITAGKAIGPQIM